MQRRRLAALLLLACSGCSTIMPNTAAAIAPNTFTDLWIGIAADVESLVQYVVLFLGI